MSILIWLSIGLDRRTPSYHLIEEIVNQLLKKKCNVTIVQKDTGGNFDFSSIKNKNVKIISLKCKNSKKNNLIYRYLNDLIYIYKCKKVFKNNFNFSKVFIQSSNVAGFQSMIIKKCDRNCSIIYNAQDLFPNNLVYLNKIKKSNLIYKLLNYTQSKIYVNANKIITISDDMRNELIESGVDSNKIVVIYNWSYQDDVYDFFETNYKIVNDIFDDNYFNVLYAGNIGIMQNVDIIIKAAEIMKDKEKSIRFIIIGDGVYKRKLMDMKDNLKLYNVFFYDMLPSKIAPLLYQRANINIIPLEENIYKTALPSKTATCLACQRPIIFCLGEKSIFGKKIEKETNCPCINSDDPIKLTEKIMKIKNNEILVHTKNHFIKYFSRTKNGKLYANLISNNK